MPSLLLKTLMWRWSCALDAIEAEKSGFRIFTGRFSGIVNSGDPIWNEGDAAMFGHDGNSLPVFEAFGK